MSVGFAALNATAKFGFFPAGKEFRQLSVVSFQSSVFSFQLSVVSFQSSLRSCRVEWKFNVTNLKILPGTGKIELTAGSPEVGTRGKRYHHNNATLKRVA